ncbi:MAG: hypothetical protein U0K86_04705 [Agathobacter sp.]|nr:hypothetical protein [Agathobacter sp.]
MEAELNRLDRLCEILWEEKHNWRSEMEIYLKVLSVIYEKFIQLINIGVVTDVTTEEVLNQIQRLMIGLEHHDNMYIADILVGEAREIVERISKEGE